MTIMVKYNTKNDWKDFLVIAVITAITYILSIIASNTGILQGGITSTNTPSDSQMSDYYATVLHSDKSKKMINRNITIVSLKDCHDRKMIARIIDVLDSLQPKVIGFDVLLPGKNDYDTILVNSILHCKNIVISKWVDDKGCLFSYPIDDYIKNKTKGIINLSGRTLLDKERCFKTRFIVDGGDTLDGFAAAVVKIADFDKYQNLSDRKQEIEYINYHRFIKFNCISLTDVVNSDGKYVGTDEDVKNKIVLIGYDEHESSNTTPMNEDIHITPINEVWPGTRIHAAAIDTILKEDYIHKISHVVVNIVALLVLFVWIWFLYWSRKNLDSFKTVISRIIQIVIILFVFITGIFFYSKNKYWDFSIITIGMGFSAVCFDIIYGIYLIIANRHKK